MDSIKIDTIKKVKERTEKMLSLMGISAKIMVLGEEGAIRVNISSKESPLLIGHHGENLFAMRHILSLVCRDLLPVGTAFMLDVDDYFKERQERLEKMVASAARRVKNTGKKEDLPAMNAYERRLVHQFASQFGVESSSEGQGEERRVVLKK